MREFLLLMKQVNDDFFYFYFLTEKNEKHILCGAKLGYDSCPYLIILDLMSANDPGVRTLLIKDN
jgi:hypothetical protein